MATMDRAPEPDDLADDDLADEDPGDEDPGGGGPAGAEGPAAVLAEAGIRAAQLDASQVWPGVLLTPEALATYEELVPGSAERILKMAEQAVKSEFEVWSDADGWGAFSLVVAVVFFGLAVGGVGRTAALIAGGVFMGVPLVIAIFAWYRWVRLRTLREERRRRDGPRSPPG